MVKIMEGREQRTALTGSWGWLKMSSSQLLDVVRGRGAGGLGDSAAEAAGHLCLDDEAALDVKGNAERFDQRKGVGGGRDQGAGEVAGRSGDEARRLLRHPHVVLRDCELRPNADGLPPSFTKSIQSSDLTGRVRRPIQMFPSPRQPVW